MRRVVPWLLVGTLATATAFGIWLGLDQAPVVGRTAPIGSGYPSTSTPVTRSTPRPRASAAAPNLTTSTTIGAAPCTAHTLELTTSVLDTATRPEMLEGAIALTNQSSVPCELSTASVFEILGSTGTPMAITASPQPGKVANEVINSGQALAADLVWRNWCGADLVPLKLALVLADGGGTIASPYGDASTMLPTCTGSSLPTNLSAHRSGENGALW